MAETPDDHHEKEGICVADVVKCAVLFGAPPAHRFLSGPVPSDENGQHLCGVLAHWCDGVIRD